MSKSIIIFDTPDSCDTCPVCVAVLGKRYCPIKGTNISKGERDCSCPSRDIPETLPYSEDKGMAMASYIQGWNDCLNALLGNS